ncbi:DUF4231 domain-containing protein [Geodermatophilus sp. URMC 61]|uniref:DUF4231 domain-containing protein n=1 Tax=Geodermatophilus sp. URMC 61 TaxID=3423411 RepID=UPI00406CF758
MPARALFRPPPFDEWVETQPSDFVAQAERYFLRVRAFYDSRARWHRHFYRISGILLILLGGALPLIASGTFTGKDVIVSAVGFVVAAITALRGFYRWDSSWVLLRGTEMALTKRYLEWKALQGGVTDPALLREEARQLLADLGTIRENESKAFFKDLPALPGTTGEAEQIPAGTGQAPASTAASASAQQ